MESCLFFFIFYTSQTMGCIYVHVIAYNAWHTSQTEANINDMGGIKARVSWMLE